MSYSKVLILLGISSIIGFIFVFGVDHQWGNLAKIETVDVNKNVAKHQLKQEVGKYQKLKQVSNRESNHGKSIDNSNFYQTIVANNLFRPLGWKPPKEEPEYKLIGTATDTKGNNSEAFVLERRSNHFYVVKIGDKIGEAVVKDIEDKMISLYKNGELITLNADSMEFLKTSGSPSHTGSTSQNERNNDTERNNQSRNRSKSTDIEAEKKRIAKLMKENQKQIKNEMKEYLKVEKDMQKEENKMLRENKKILISDLKLKK